MIEGISSPLSSGIYEAVAELQAATETVSEICLMGDNVAYGTVSGRKPFAISHIKQLWSCTFYGVDLSGSLELYETGT